MLRSSSAWVGSTVKVTLPVAAGVYCQTCSGELLPVQEYLTQKLLAETKDVTVVFNVSTGGKVVRRKADLGGFDEPWPPVYPKQPHEPPRVAPSRAKKT